MEIETDKSRVLPAAPRSPLPRRHLQTTESCPCPPPPSPTLTGDVERNGALRAHTSPGEGHMTGEVGAVVLRTGGEQELRGVIGLQVQSQRSERSSRPGEGEGGHPITDPGHRACEVAGRARRQGLLDTDIRGLCQRWRGDTRPEGTPLCVPLKEAPQP